MSEQLKLDEFVLPEAATRDVQPNHSPEAHVVCAECGLAMKNMGPSQSRFTHDYDDILGIWKFSCRAARHASADLVVHDDGTVEVHDNVGEGHEIVDANLREVDGVGYVYEPYKDPTEWEEPED